MNQILRTNVGCLIRPYKKGQNKPIERMTSIYDSVYHKYIPYAGFLIPYFGSNTFVTYNHSLDYLKANFKDYEIEEFPMTLYKPMSNKINLCGIKEFRPAQSQIIQEILRTKKKTNTWFVNLQTGQGKTLLSIYLSTEFNLKTMVLCFSDEILNQWKTAYLKYTDIEECRILHLTGKIIDNILSGDIDIAEYDVFLSTPTLLDRYGSTRMNYIKITDLFNLCGIGLYIYDEAHRNVSNIVKLGSITNVKYQLYLSADFGQGNYEKEMMYKRIFQNVQIISPSEEDQKSMNYTDIIVIDYNTNPSGFELTEPFNKYGYSPELYMKYQFKKKILINAIIKNIEMIRTKDTERRILILFINIEHVEKMYSILKEYFPNENIGRYYSSIPNDEKEWSKNSASIIVATYSSFSTGLDTENIKYVFSPNQCNKIMDNQAAGRARPLSDGSNALYFIFIDSGFKYCNRKLRIRLQYLNKTKSRSSQVYRIVYKE